MRPLALLVRLIGDGIGTILGGTGSRSRYLISFLAMDSLYKHHIQKLRQAVREIALILGIKLDRKT